MSIQPSIFSPTMASSKCFGKEYAKSVIPGFPLNQQSKDFLSWSFHQDHQIK